MTEEESAGHRRRAVTHGFQAGDHVRSVDEWSGEWEGRVVHVAHDAKTHHSAVAVQAEEGRVRWFHPSNLVRVDEQGKDMMIPWRVWPARQLAGRETFHGLVGRERADQWCGHEHRSRVAAMTCAHALMRRLNRDEALRLTDSAARALMAAEAAVDEAGGEV